MIEENVVVGNVNGITIAQGAEKNSFRRNVVIGNPPVQVAADHASVSGSDIRNLSGSGTNVFQANVCVTSVNAPCSAVAPSLTANPNPIPVTASALYGMTTINWFAPGVPEVEVRVGSPDGPMFGSGTRGSFETGIWVADGMTFYLQDVTGGKPLTAENTLASVVVRLQRR